MKGGGGRERKNKRERDKERKRRREREHGRFEQGVMVVDKGLEMQPRVG